MTVAAWTPQQLAGQRLMVGFEGTGFTERLRELVAHLGVGGLILFSRNIESPDQLRALIADAQACAADAGLPPLLIAVDQEGGTVARLRAPWTEFPGMAHLTHLAEARRFGQITGRELIDVGIGMDMAPVMDRLPEAGESIMADRAFDWDPVRVAQMGVAVINALQSEGVLAVAKHFPGIGRTVIDSHIDRPVLDDPLSEMGGDLLPFAAAMAANVAGIMLSHIDYPQLDPDWPASLSEIIARDLLRRRMGFNGLVITDDLDMGAVVNHVDAATVSDRVLAADIDVALICRNQTTIDAVAERMTHAIADTPDLRRRAEASVWRMIAAKRRVPGFRSF